MNFWKENRVRDREEGKRENERDLGEEMRES